MLRELFTKILGDRAQSVGLVAEVSQLSNPYVFAHVTRSVTKFPILIMLDNSASPSDGLARSTLRSSITWNANGPGW